MTIIRPQKENYMIKYLIVGLASALVVVSIGGVFLYNKIVSTKHEITRYKTLVRGVEVKNAELKNNYYNFTNRENSSEIAKAAGLLLDKNPEYVKKQLVVINAY